MTQEEYKQIMGNIRISRRPSDHDFRSFQGFDRSRFPLEDVSWDDATAFCKKLSLIERRNYRLPTEAEWEYACRARTKTAFHFGDVLNGEQANCNGNYPYGTNVPGKYLGETTVVGSYSPNAFGLYDMHGNVWEWCSDWYADYSGDVDDPQGPDSGDYRVVRGGVCYVNPSRCRSAYRFFFSPNNRRDNSGFRVVCEVGPPSDRRDR